MIFSVIFGVYVLTMDRFGASTRVVPSGASSRKRQFSWLEHDEIIENHGRNGLRVKRVHCEGVMKMHAGLVLASSLTSGDSL